MAAAVKSVNRHWFLLHFAAVRIMGRAVKVAG
jgi:hypothetical protein